jgi:hypothetical protein
MAPVGRGSTGRMAMDIHLETGIPPELHRGRPVVPGAASLAVIARPVCGGCIWPCRSLRPGIRNADALRAAGDLSNRATVLLHARQARITGGVLVRVRPRRSFTRSLRCSVRRTAGTVGWSARMAPTVPSMVEAADRRLTVRDRDLLRRSDGAAGCAGRVVYFSQVARRTSGRDAHMRPRPRVLPAPSSARTIRMAA